MKKVHQKRTSMWHLGLSPLVWSIHFLFAYILAAVWCAKFAGRGGNLQEVRLGILIATIFSLLVVGREIFIGYQKHTFGDEEPPHNEATPEDRERFLGLARLLISSLSFLAITYTAYVAWVFRSCI